MNGNKSNRGKAFAVIGALLQFGRLCGTGLTFSRRDISDPQQFSSAIGDALITTIVGLGFSLIGLVLICIALFASRYRAPWFFWFLLIYSGILLFGFPIGTILGIVILSFCLTHRHEFSEHAELKQQATNDVSSGTEV